MSKDFSGENNSNSRGENPVEDNVIWINRDAPTPGVFGFNTDGYDHELAKLSRGEEDTRALNSDDQDNAYGFTSRERTIAQILGDKSSPDERISYLDRAGSGQATAAFFPRRSHKTTVSEPTRVGGGSYFRRHDTTKTGFELGLGFGKIRRRAAAAVFAGSVLFSIFGSSDVPEASVSVPVPYPAGLPGVDWETTPVKIGETTINTDPHMVQRTTFTEDIAPSATEIEKTERESIVIRKTRISHQKLAFIKGEHAEKFAVSPEATAFNQEGIDSLLEQAAQVVEEYDVQDLHFELRVIGMASDDDEASNQDCAGLGLPSPHNEELAALRAETIANATLGSLDEMYPGAPAEIVALDAEEVVLDSGAMFELGKTLNAENQDRLIEDIDTCGQIIHEYNDGLLADSDPELNEYLDQVLGEARGASVRLTISGSYDKPVTVIEEVETEVITPGETTMKIGSEEVCVATENISAEFRDRTSYDFGWDWDSKKLGATIPLAALLAILPLLKAGRVERRTRMYTHSYIDEAKVETEVAPAAPVKKAPIATKPEVDLSDKPGCNKRLWVIIGGVLVLATGSGLALSQCDPKIGFGPSQGSTGESLPTSPVERMDCEFRTIVDGKTVTVTTTRVPAEDVAEIGESYGTSSSFKRTPRDN